MRSRLEAQGACRARKICERLAVAARTGRRAGEGRQAASRRRRTVRRSEVHKPPARLRGVIVTRAWQRFRIRDPWRSPLLPISCSTLRAPPTLRNIGRRRATARLRRGAGAETSMHSAGGERRLLTPSRRYQCCCAPARPLDDGASVQSRRRTRSLRPVRGLCAAKLRPVDASQERHKPCSARASRGNLEIDAAEKSATSSPAVARSELPAIGAGPAMGPFAARL